MKRILLSCSLAATLSLAAMQVQAFPATIPPTFQALTEQADMVFQGKVTKIEYKNSATTDGTKGSPYTFVTYQISQVIAGSYSDPTITLRFLGGDDPSTGTFLEVTESPLFDVGDEDILYVSGNGASECPLVGCAQGRLRIINGSLQDDEGREILAPTNMSSYIKGERKPSAAVDTAMIGNIKVTLTESPESPAQQAASKARIKALSNLPKANVQGVKNETKRHKPRGSSPISEDPTKRFIINNPRMNLPSKPAITFGNDAGAPTNTLQNQNELSELQQREAETEINSMAVDPIKVIGNP